MPRPRTIVERLADIEQRLVRFQSDADAALDRQAQKTDQLLSAVGRIEAALGESAEPRVALVVRGPVTDR
jgi:hypothetical protein